MKEKELKTSKEWYEFVSTDFDILDPDGWDRANYEYSFYEEKITKEEFQKRVFSSTIQAKKPITELFKNL